MLTITITDVETATPETLRRIANLLQNFAGEDVPAQEYSQVQEDSETLTGFENWESGTVQTWHDPETRKKAQEVFNNIPLPPVETEAEVAEDYNVAEIDTDVNFIPWDARIHSKTKSKTADGAWRVKRGVEPKFIKTVEKELRMAMAIPHPVATIAQPELPKNPGGIPLPPTQTGVTDFASLMKKVVEVVTDKKISKADITRIVQSVGLPSVQLAGSRPDLIPTIWSLIELEVAS